MSKYRVVQVCVLCACFVPGLQAQSAVDADFDGNGLVDFSDFLVFATAFGGTDPEYDFDASGNVDFPDFLHFVSVFGQATGVPPLVAIRLSCPTAPSQYASHCPSGEKTGDVKFGSVPGINRASSSPIARR